MHIPGELSRAIGILIGAERGCYDEIRDESVYQTDNGSTRGGKGVSADSGREDWQWFNYVSAGRLRTYCQETREKTTREQANLFHVDFPRSGIHKQFARRVKRLELSFWTFHSWKSIGLISSQLGICCRKFRLTLKASIGCMQATRSMPPVLISTYLSVDRKTFLNLDGFHSRIRFTFAQEGIP